MDIRTNGAKKKKKGGDLGLQNGEDGGSPLYPLPFTPGVMAQQATLNTAHPYNLGQLWVQFTGNIMTDKRLAN